MITEYKSLTLEILETYPKTRGDNGANELLNIASRMILKDKQVDFNIFKAESWTRARRKVLAENPHLDERTARTTLAESIVKSEMVA